MKALFLLGAALAAANGQQFVVITRSSAGPLQLLDGGGVDADAMLMMREMRVAQEGMMRGRSQRISDPEPVPGWVLRAMDEQRESEQMTRSMDALFQHLVDYSFAAPIVGQAPSLLPPSLSPPPPCDEPQRMIASAAVVAVPPAPSRAPRVAASTMAATGAHSPLLVGGLVAATVACAMALATVFVQRARRAKAYEDELQLQVRHGALYRPLLV